MPENRTLHRWGRSQTLRLRGFWKTPRIWVAGLAIMVATTGCAHRASRKEPFQPPPPPQYSAQEIGAMFERPTTLAQLLRNVKIGVDRSVLAQPGFGTEANLLTFFDGTAIKREPVDSNIARFDQQDTFISVDETHFPQMMVKVRLGLLREQAHQTPTARLPPRIRHFAEIQLTVAGTPDFTAHTVREVFGKETEFRTGDTGGAKGVLIYRYPDDEPIQMLVPGEYRQVIVVMQWPPPGASLGPPPLHPGRQINDSDEVIRVSIYVPEP